MSSINFISTDRRKKLRSIRLDKTELLREIECLSYKLAETLVADENAKDNIAADTGDKLDAALLKMFIASRDAALRQMIGFALWDESTEVMPNCQIVDNNVVHEPNLCSEDYFCYDLALPIGFKDSYLGIVKQLFHDYLVRGTMLDWYHKCGSGYAGIVIDDVVDLQNRVVDILREPAFVQHPRIAYIPFGRR